VAPVKFRETPAEPTPHSGLIVYAGALRMRRNNIALSILFPSRPAGAPLILALHIGGDSRFPRRNRTPVPDQTGTGDPVHI